MAEEGEPVAPRRMTRKDYLRARGWHFGDTHHDSAQDLCEWTDPELGAHCDALVAVARQQARDAAEERRAWVQFAAAALQHPGLRTPEVVMKAADLLTDGFRKRFGIGPVEVP